MKINKLILLLILSGFFACKSEKEELPIAPEDIKIDVELGGLMTTDQVLLNYKKAGVGSKIIIVPSATYLSEDFKELEHDFTFIYYDMRNRGRSQSVNNPAKLNGGILKDVEDLEAVRQHFKLEKINLIGHSYLGLMAAMYAQQYPDKVGKIVQIGAVQPFSADQFTAYTDSVNAKVQEELAALDQQKSNLSKNQYCEQWWNITRKMYAANPDGLLSLSNRICQYPNEHPEKMLAYFQQYIYPSIQNLTLTKEDYKVVKAPVLVIQGDKDRVVSVDAAKSWKATLPNAKLEVIENAGHMPWVEREAKVFEVIRDFFNG